MIVLRELTKEYMEKFGYADAEITTVLHQWMGGFPQDEAKAYAVICWGSAVAALSKATKDRQNAAGSDRRSHDGSQRRRPARY